MWFGPPSVGDHVRLTRTHSRLWGGDIRKGAFGIVRDTSYGLFASDVLVEMADGSGTIRVPTRHVRRTGGHGEDGFQRRRDWHRAKLFAGCIGATIVAFELLRYKLAGGQWGDLILPMLTELFAVAVALVTGPFGLLVIVAVVIAATARRLRR
jgi:hypothetical protein